MMVVQVGGNGLHEAAMIRKADPLGLPVKLTELALKASAFSLFPLGSQGIGLRRRDHLLVALQDVRRKSLVRA
jgi:hypothetical protein